MAAAGDPPYTAKSRTTHCLHVFYRWSRTTHCTTESLFQVEWHCSVVCTNSPWWYNVVRWHYFCRCAQKSQSRQHWWHIRLRWKHDRLFAWERTRHLWRTSWTAVEWRISLRWHSSFRFSPLPSHREQCSRPWRSFCLAERYSVSHTWLNDGILYCLGDENETDRMIFNEDQYRECYLMSFRWNPLSYRKSLVVPSRRWIRDSMRHRFNREVAVSSGFTRSTKRCGIQQVQHGAAHNVNSENRITMTIRKRFIGCSWR